MQTITRRPINPAKVETVAKAIQKIAQSGKCFEGKTLGELDIYTKYNGRVRYQYREDCWGTFKQASVSVPGLTLVEVTWRGCNPRGKKLHAEAVTR